MKPLPRVLLVPIDFSDASHRALDLAQTLATAAGEGARVVLVTVVQPTPMPVTAEVVGVAPVPPVDTTAETDAAKKGLIAWSKSVPGATHVVRVGSAVDEILALAASEGAGMIVLGTHGRKGVARALLGSVAESVARRSTVPVVLVH